MLTNLSHIGAAVYLLLPLVTLGDADSEYSDMELWMNLQRDYDIWMTSKHANKIHVLPLDEAA